MASFFNKVACVKVRNSIKKRLQYSRFPVKFANFIRTPFLQNSFSGCFLKMNSCFQRSPEQKQLRLSAINTIFSCKKVFAATKIQKQPPSVFCKRRSATFLLERGSSIAKFLRTLILKNICERLLLKISISVTNSEAVVQRSSIRKVFLETSKNS